MTPHEAVYLRYSELEGAAITFGSTVYQKTITMSQLFDFISTPVAGCFDIQPHVLADHRGKFVKAFHSEAFRKRGLPDTFQCVKYAAYNRHVVRGLHFQHPPHSSDHVAYSVQGSFLKVVVDLRKSSPTYRKVHSVRLEAERGNMLYYPAGVAHGFMALDDNSIHLMLSTREEHTEFKGGLHWRSIDFDWPVQNPIVSDDDNRLPHLAHYASPF